MLSFVFIRTPVKGDIILGPRTAYNKKINKHSRHLEIINNQTTPSRSLSNIFSLQNQRCYRSTKNERRTKVGLILLGLDSHWDLSRRIREQLTKENCLSRAWGYGVWMGLACECSHIIVLCEKRVVRGKVAEAKTFPFSSLRVLEQKDVEILGDWSA